MHIDTLVLGEFQSNSFVVRRDEKAPECVIIDAGYEADSVLGFLSKQNCRVVAVVLTHGHCDHLAGVQTLKERFADLKLYVHADDAAMLADAKANLSAFFGEAVTVTTDVCTVRDQAVIREAGVELTVIHTPGHTPGGICLYNAQAGVLFSDDTLFAGGIGRTDFPNSDAGRLMDSIRTRLLTLPDATVVYPGHGPCTTLGQERVSNPWLQNL